MFNTINKSILFYKKYNSFLENLTQKAQKSYALNNMMYVNKIFVYQVIVKDDDKFKFFLTNTKLKRVKECLGICQVKYKDLKKFCVLQMKKRVINDNNLPFLC